MFCKFRQLSDVQRYKKCSSNVAMRGCSAQAQQNMHFFSINHANTSYFAAIISDNIHSSNRKIFHKRRIQRYWIKVSGIFTCPMNLVELNEWIICRQPLQQIRHLPRCFSRLLALLAIWFNSVVDWCSTQWLINLSCTGLAYPVQPVTLTRAWTSAWTRAWTSAWTSIKKTSTST